MNTLLLGKKCSIPTSFPKFSFSEEKVLAVSSAGVIWNQPEKCHSLNREDKWRVSLLPNFLCRHNESWAVWSWWVQPNGNLLGQCQAQQLHLNSKQPISYFATVLQHMLCL